MGGEALTLKADDWYLSSTTAESGWVRDYGSEEQIPLVKYVPQATVSYTGIANIDSKWNTLAQTIGKTNNGTVDMFAPNTLLFMGIDADKRLGSSDTETTYNFAFNYHTWNKVFDPQTGRYLYPLNFTTDETVFSEANFASIF
jgi:hypothetical protein